MYLCKVTRTVMGYTTDENYKRKAVWLEPGCLCYLLRCEADNEDDSCNLDITPKILFGLSVEKGPIYYGPIVLRADKQSFADAVDLLCELDYIEIIGVFEDAR